MQPTIATPHEIAIARAEWQSAVANESTWLGFLVWCEHQSTLDNADLMESALPQATLAAIAYAN